MKHILYIPAALLAVMPGLAEDTYLVSGPVLGYVQRSAAVRPILGIPGAAYFAPAVDLGGLEVASVSSGAGYAVLVTADRMSVRILALRTMESIRMFTGSGSAVNSVRLSAGGTAAALLRERSIDIISGLPNHPVLSRTIEVPEGSSAFAVSDDGEALAVSDGSTIRIFDGGGQRELGKTHAVHDLRFRPHSQELVYIDGDSVVVSSAYGLRMIAGAADGLSAPRSALFVRDGSSVAIADAASATVWIVPLSGGSAERVKLPCVAVELASMNDSTLKLECNNTNQVHLLQLTPNGTRVLFVPEPVE